MPDLDPCRPVENEQGWLRPHPFAKLSIDTRLMDTKYDSIHRFREGRKSLCVYTQISTLEDALAPGCERAREAGQAAILFATEPRLRVVLLDPKAIIATQYRR